MADVSVTPGSLLRGMWAALGAPVQGRMIPGTGMVAGVAAAIGFLACLYTTGQGTNLDYSDAQSHLTIARRIFDSKSPGFEQLGTVWLPVPHLLLVPFVLNMWLFNSGWAACLLGTAALSATASGLYRITVRLGLGRAGRIAAVHVLVANPAVLYVYTTALTDPVLIMCLVAGMAGLAHWATSRRRMSAGELAVFAGIPSGAAVLSRYEGWAMVLTGTVFVLVAFGAVALILRRGLSNSTLLVAVTGSAYAFALLSLYLGQTAINNDHSLPSTWWNNRFALTALPLIAVLVAFAVTEIARARPVRMRPWAIGALLVALLVQNAWWMQDPATRLAVLAEGRMSAESTRNSTAAAR